MQWTQRVFLLGLLSVGAPATADQDPWYTDVPPEPWGGEAPAKEQHVAVPPFPADADLLALDSQSGGYGYQVDRESLSVGDDGVVSYTIVIDAPGGARNVLFEGIRCRTREYRTYAYGIGDGPFQRASNTQWTPIAGRGAFGYRRDLQEIYLCRGLTPRASVDEMVRRIQYPPSVNDPHFRD